MFKIIDTNKGKSVIAECDIPKDTIIFEEIPIVIGEDMYDCIYNIYENDTASLEIEFNKLTPYELDKYAIKYDEILNHIRTLPQYMQDFFLNFKPEKLRLVCTKFYRNAFTYNSQSAILMKGRLLNHSCDYNTNFYLDAINNKYIFKTNRFIKKNEEITDHYIDVNLSIKKRKNLLLTQYGFNCSCIKCNNLVL
jgi:hypothetical protein